VRLRVASLALGGKWMVSSGFPFANCEPQSGIVGGGFHDGFWPDVGSMEQRRNALRTATKGRTRKQSQLFG
jgi:hypothetical protein